MGIVCGAKDPEWGAFLRRSGGLHPGDAIERLMAAWITWRQIPVPRWLQPAVQRAHQPPVTPTPPGTYGNAAVAQGTHIVAAPAWFSSNMPS